MSRTPFKRIRQQKYQASILDIVLGEAGRLRSSVDPEDRRKRDEYFCALREKENATRVMPDMSASSSSLPDNMTEHSKLVFDLLTVAFQSDLTRVATLQKLKTVQDGDLLDRSMIVYDRGQIFMQAATGVA